MSNHTSTIIGGSMFSGGIVGEVSKKEAPMNLMDFVLTFIRNSKNDDWIEKIVKKPKKRIK